MLLSAHSVACPKCSHRSNTSSGLQIAVMRESDARGPFCSTVMAVVVVKDVLLFVCLAMNLEFANMVSHQQSSLSELALGRKSMQLGVLSLACLHIPR